LEKDEFAFTFGVNNYFLDWGESSEAPRAHDLLLFDVILRYGIIKKTEFALKYSYPNTALIRFKYNFIDNYKIFEKFKIIEDLKFADKLNLNEKAISISAEFGIGQYKLTKQNYVTDYIIDLYPGLIFDLSIYKNISVYFGPKFIYSFYLADRCAKSEPIPRTPWKTEKCSQSGYVWGISIGERTMFTLENTWHWVNYEGIKYKIHMQGLAITRIFE
jgi:hypothetical protein